MNGLAWSRWKRFIWKYWLEADPREIKSYVENASDDSLKTIVKSYDYDKGPNQTAKGSPQDLQKRLLTKEMRKRGLTK